MTGALPDPLIFFHQDFENSAFNIYFLVATAACDRRHGSRALIPIHFTDRFVMDAATALPHVDASHGIQMRRCYTAAGGFPTLIVCRCTTYEIQCGFFGGSGWSIQASLGA